MHSHQTRRTRAGEAAAVHSPPPTQIARARVTLRGKLPPPQAYAAWPGGWTAMPSVLTAAVASTTREVCEFCPDLAMVFFGRGSSSRVKEEESPRRSINWLL